VKYNKSVCMIMSCIVCACVCEIVRCVCVMTNVEEKMFVSVYMMRIDTVRSEHKSIVQ